MNPHLQNISDLILQAESWTAEQKNAAAALLKAADKELEITKFKLDRTEKVKRTTAILLEETIEELEQKRKAVEATNRELEIESSLERVRTVAMSMNKADDMLLVCRIISEQLELLKVKEIRNVQTAIIYEEAGTYLNYEYYTKHDKTFITDVNFSLHPAQFEFVNSMLKGPEEFFSKHFTGKEVQDWYEYQKSTNQFADSFLETASSLNYHWYSMGPVALGISTYTPLTEEEVILFKRFRNVFELAYRRYLDIEIAVQQAKDARIEVALERARTQSMIMQHSKELDDTLRIFHEQILMLAIPSAFSYLWLPDEEKKEHMFWATWLEEGNGARVFKSKAVTYPLNRNEPATAQCLVDWKSNERVFSYGVSPAEVSNYFTVWKELIDGVEKLTAGHFPKGLHYTEAFMKYGCFGVISESNLSEDEKKILCRFAVEFERAYTRFLDLQKAEEQAREAQINLAVERVRAKALAMYRSEEILDVVFKLKEEVMNLNIPNVVAATVYLIEKSGMHRLWDISSMEAIEGKLHIPLDMSFRLEETDPDLFIRRVWSDTEKYFLVTQDENDLKRTIQWLKDNGRTKEAEETDEFIKAAQLKKLYHPTIQLNNGRMCIDLLEAPSDEIESILSKMGAAFDLAYKRFEDLENSEEQLREAQIEAALERVRSRSLAMHKSIELKEVVAVLFEKLQDLGIPATSAGINIFIEGSKDLDAYVCGQNEDGKVVSNFRLPYFNNPIGDDVYFARETGSGFFTKTYTFEEKNSYWSYQLEHSELKYLPNDIKELILQSESYTLSMGLAKHSMLAINDFEGKRLSEKEQDILKRFSKVFEQAYTRFLDLQKAEVQAREAQIELALERVRARTMAMQKSEELHETSQILFQQMKELGEPVEQLTIGIVNETENVVEIFATIQGSQLQQSFRHSIDETVMNKIYRGWKAKQKSLLVEMNSEEIQVYNRYRNKLVKSEMFSTTVSKNDRRIIYAAYFSKGMLALGSNTPLSEESHRLLERFAGVFDGIYTRFLDLQKAEAQTREAQINLAVERVRAKALAMYRSEEILELVFKLKQEVMNLDIPNVAAATIHLKENDGNCTMWDLTAMEAVDGKLHQPMVVHYRLEELDPALFISRMWENNAPYFVVVQDKEDFKRTIQFLRDHDRTKEADESEAFLKLAETEHAYHPTIPLQNGRMCIDLLEPPSDEIEMILTKMGAAFDLAYKRFEDLQKAEAQSREAQIETALERVRSRSMAMQKSEELEEVIQVVYQQFVHLNIHIAHTGFVMDYKVRDDYNIWIADPLGVPSRVTIPYFDSVYYNRFNEAKEKGEDFFATNLSFAEKNKFYQKLFEYVPELPEEAKEFYFNCTGLAASTVLLENICLYIENFKGIPYSNEENAILMRFGKVFQQTYTRFLDLQKAEAQAREAKIETALERVRARALAMQEPEELKEVAQVLRHEMGLLGVEELETCSIYITDENAVTAECWYALKDVRRAEKKLVNDHFVLNLNDTGVGREMFNFYRSAEQKTSIVMQGANRKEWINYCEEKSVPFRGFYGEVIPDRTYHLYKFSHGAIGAATPGDISDESFGLLKRAASVFSLAYSRFKDLSQARTDLIKLKEEKKRAEDALNELQVTQKQLIQSEKMASLGELTAGIAHEIQNPLNFVNNFSEVSNELIDEMIEEVAKGNYEEVKAIAGDVKQNLEKINHHGRRADGIVKGMLQHSRTSSAVKEPTDINKLAGEYLRLSYHGLRAKDKSFNATIKTDYDETIDKINVIPQDIGRVILNLITNAFYAAPLPPEGGFTDPTYKHEPTVWLSTKKAGDKVLISIRDNGPGIPKKILDKIFQPFFTTKPTGQGTGLGLSLSYDIVKAHGGELKVETKEGEGTVFIVQLPVV